MRSNIIKNFIKTAFRSFISNKDNSKLSNMIETFMSDEKNFSKNYADFGMAASKEFIEGNSKVYIPGIVEDFQKPQKSMKILSARMHEGKYTLWLFSSPKKISEWAKKNCSYYELSSKDAIAIINHNNFEKVIIDNLFPITQYRKDQEEVKITAGTEIIIGISANPLSKDIVKFYASEFKKIKEVLGVYQYQMLTKGNIGKINELTIGIYAPKVSKNKEKEVFQ